MIRIALTWIADSLSVLERVSRVDDQTARNEKWLLFRMAQVRLEQLYSNSVYRPFLRVSSEKANALHAMLVSQQNLLNGLENALNDGSLAELRFEASAFVEV